MYFDGMYTVVGCKGEKKYFNEAMKNVILPEFLKRETSVPVEMTITPRIILTVFK